MVDSQLCRLPNPLRITLTAFLAMLGVGYLFAIANIFGMHSGADGKPGLSLDDLRAAYSGLTITRDSRTVVPSRMLQMIEGSMRQYVSDDEDYAALHGWLAEGNGESGLDAKRDGRTPRRVITLNCLRCHAADSGKRIGTIAPFGPDQLTVDYAMIGKFTTAAPQSSRATVRVGPQESPHLILVTHAHMLAIPIFTLIVATLFWHTRLPVAVRSPVTPIPMLVLVVDFASWWIARISPGFIYLIAAAGGMYGLTFGVQIITIVIDLWRPAPPTSATSAASHSRPA